MKKALFIIGGVIVLFIAILLITPLIFKDEIKAKIEQEIQKELDANVYFDTDKFGLSFFRHFPSLTVSLRDFGVVGKDKFERDTLVSVNSFETSLDIRSVLFGEQIKINGIYLNKPVVLIKVLEDGTKNYDIMLDKNEESEEADTLTSEVSVAIDKWVIKDGHIIYDDRAQNIYTAVSGLNHKGKGDFSRDIFDLETKTSVENFDLKYENISYVSNKQLDITLDLLCDQKKSMYTFRENRISVNDFSFTIEGVMKTLEEDIDLDLTLSAQENKFKNLLSLVPGVFVKGFEGIKADGHISFDGFIKGRYSESQKTIPAFNIKLLVEEGQFQYPDLPNPVSNIKLDMLLDNKDGNLDHTHINVKSFHMDIGSNPVDATLTIQGLERPDINASVLAKINLEELSSILPMSDLSLKGLYSVDLKAQGVYDSKTSRMPSVNASMSLRDGYVKSKEFPAPIENLNFNAVASNNTGKMAATVLDVSNFSFMLDGEKLNGRLKLSDLDDYNWDLMVNGNADLDKLTKIYPLDKDMQLSGKIKADITTKGRMSDVTAGRYEKISSSGTMDIKGFKYVGKEVPQGIEITNAQASFDPRKVTIKNVLGSTGTTDFAVNGDLSNYINYLLKENEPVVGNMTLRSKRVDINEWMSGEETPKNMTDEEVEMEPVIIPQNINLVLRSEIETLFYDNLTLTDVKGDIIVRDGKLNFNKLNFNTLDGRFVTSGTYDSRDVNQPKFNLNIEVEDLSILKAYQASGIVEKFAPVVKFLENRADSKFDTNFNLNGVLKKDMSPVYNTIIGDGIIKIGRTTVNSNPIVSGIANFTKLNLDETKLYNTIMKAQIKDGRLHTEPFNIKIGEIDAVVEGSNGVDGSIDYLIKMDMPDKLSKISDNKGVNKAVGLLANKLNTIRVEGTLDKPKLSLVVSEKEDGFAGEAKGVAKSLIDNESEQLKKELEKQKKEAEKKAQEELEKQKKIAEEKAKEEAERLKKEAEEKAKEEADKAKEKVKDKLKGIFKKD